MYLKTSPYDDYADEYAAYVAERELGGVAGDPILPHLLAQLGDVAGHTVLDAGCGEGYLARILAEHGARVTGIDLAPRLIELSRARARNATGAIDYRVAELSAPLSEDARHFDAVASYLVLNDVEDYRGFAATIADVLRPGGPAVLALNNPYADVVRKGIQNCFASGTTHPCGLARAASRLPSTTALWATIWKPSCAVACS